MNCSEYQHSEVTLKNSFSSSRKLRTKWQLELPNQVVTNKKICCESFFAGVKEGR